MVLYVIWTDANGSHHSRILTGKCRVAPLLGTTVPRGELQAIVILHRLIATVVDAFPGRFQSISTFTDSLCSIGALNKSTSSLRPFFANRVLEVLRIREGLSEYTDELPPVCHIPGELNPADLGTRGLVNVGDLGPGSTWQTGPPFLVSEFSEWPSVELRGRDSVGRADRRVPGAAWVWQGGITQPYQASAARGQH